MGTHELSQQSKFVSLSCYLAFSLDDLLWLFFVAYCTHISREFSISLISTKWVERDPRTASVTARQKTTPLRPRSLPPVVEMLEETSRPTLPCQELRDLTLELKKTETADKSAPVLKAEVEDNEREKAISAISNFDASNLKKAETNDKSAPVLKAEIEEGEEAKA